MKKMIKKIMVVIGWIVLGWLLGFISCTLVIREINIMDNSSYETKIKSLKEEVAYLREENKSFKEKPLSTEKKFDMIRKELKGTFESVSGDVLSAVSSQVSLLNILSDKCLIKFGAKGEPVTYDLSDLTGMQLGNLRQGFYECIEIFCNREYDGLNGCEEAVALLLIGNTDERFQKEGKYIFKKISAMRELVSIYREMLMLVCDNIRFYSKGSRPVFQCAKVKDENIQKKIDELNKRMSDVENRIHAQKRDIVSIALKGTDDLPQGKNGRDSK